MTMEGRGETLHAVQKNAQTTVKSTSHACPVVSIPHSKAPYFTRYSRRRAEFRPAPRFVAKNHRERPAKIFSPRASNWFFRTYRKICCSMIPAFVSVLTFRLPGTLISGRDHQVVGRQRRLRGIRGRDQSKVGVPQASERRDHVAVRWQRPHWGKCFLCILLGQFDAVVPGDHGRHFAPDLSEVEVVVSRTCGPRTAASPSSGPMRSMSRSFQTPTGLWPLTRTPRLSSLPDGTSVLDRQSIPGLLVAKLQSVTESRTVRGNRSGQTLRTAANHCPMTTGTSARR